MEGSLLATGVAAGLTIGGLALLRQAHVDPGRRADESLDDNPFFEFFDDAIVGLGVTAGAAAVLAAGAVALPEEVADAGLSPIITPRPGGALLGFAGRF